MARAAALSAGNGAEEIYGQSSEGIFQRLGNGWSPQLKGPVDPSFPGCQRPGAGAFST